MENNKDWEELEEWQKEQELKLNNNEKYYKNAFNKNKIKEMNIFSKTFNFATKSISSIIVIIFIIALILAMAYIYTLFATVAPQNTSKYLQKIYRGEKFEVIEDYSQKNSNGKGLYILSPKSNKEIIFKAYNGGSGIKDDYSAQRLKYYIQNCENKSLLEDFDAQESTETTENIQFLKYSINTKINDYYEIENKVKETYELAKYLHQKDDKMYEPINIVNWDISYYFSIQCDLSRTLEQEIYRAKYVYISNLKQNNNQEILNKIGNEEISKIWKPETLLLFINGKQMKLYNDGQAMVYYRPENKNYYMSGGDVILQQIEQIEVLETGKMSGFVKKIKYKDKEYKVKQSSDNGTGKSNVIYISGTLEEFLEKFDSEINYDYDNGKVFVTIK